MSNRKRIAALEQRIEVLERQVDLLSAQLKKKFQPVVLQRWKEYEDWAWRGWILEDDPRPSWSRGSMASAPSITDLIRG